MPLSGRVAWVTGAGRGIGRAAAVALAGAGCSVGLSARTASELESARKECGRKAVVAACDVTRPDEVDLAFTAVSKALGAPSILVNAAGLARSEAFLKTTPEFMESLWALNVMGTFHPTKAALPKMLEASWGRIVNVASVAGKAGAPYIAAYAASKHGVLGLTRSLAAEFASKGVTVNAVCPGYVETGMTDDNVALMVKKTGRAKEEILEHIRSRSPQHRLIRPDEVAAEVVHLCQDESAGINGQAITIDGGALQW